MKVWGLSESQIQQWMPEGLRFEVSGHAGNAIQGRIVPSREGKVSETPYCRRSASGRWLRATCYHGFVDGISFLFWAGATRVKSSAGDWRTIEEFRADCDRMAQTNIGSQMQPLAMIDACDCASTWRKNGEAS